MKSLLQLSLVTSDINIKVISAIHVTVITSGNSAINISARPSQTPNIPDCHTIHTIQCHTCILSPVALSLYIFYLNRSRERSPAHLEPGSAPRFLPRKGIFSLAKSACW